MMDNENQDQEHVQPRVQVDTQPHIEDLMNYAGFWARFFAYILDAIIFTVVGAIVMALTYDILIASNLINIGGLAIDFQRSGFNSLLTIVVTILFWKHRRATPGKMMMDISIVDATTGETPPTSKLILRYFSYFVSALPLGLGFLWIAFDKREQGFHDKIANTVVIVTGSKEVEDTDD
jgi:uncharacterized RDD family membrane protein YckC